MAIEAKERIILPDDKPVDNNDPPIEELVKFLFADPRIKYFFEVSLPSAKKRNELLGHVLFVCPDTRTRDYFLRFLQAQYYAHYRMTSFDLLERSGDLAELLTNMGENDVLVCEALSANLQDCILEPLSAALSSFTLDVMIGKGPSANSIQLDLPKFTFVACVANETGAIRKLLPYFEYVLKVDNTSLPKLCAAQLRNSAEAASFSIDESACDLIVSKANFDAIKSERYLKRILEYVAVQEKNVTRITSDLAERVFDISGMAAKFDTPSDEDEMFSIFRDIQETLHLMHNEMRQMREDVNGSLSRIEEALEYME